MSLEFETEEFNRAAELCIKHSERTYDKFINGRAYFLAKAALENTKAADPMKIAHDLGAVSTKLRRDRKTGRLKKGKLQYDVNSFDMDSFAARIVNSRRKRLGLPMLWGKALYEAVKKLRAAAPRSANFIRAGWIWPMKQLQTAARGEKTTPAQVSFKRSTTPKGFAIPAESALNSVVTATIGNSSLLAVSARRTGLRRGNPMPVASAGLEKAYAVERANMLKHLAEKLGPEFAKF